MKQQQSRLILALTLAIVALGLAIWLVTSVHDLYARIAEHSRPVAIGVISAVGLALAGCALLAGRLFWSLSTDRSSRAAQAPADLIQAATVQADQARDVVAQVADSPEKARLEGELKELRRDRESEGVAIGLVFAPLLVGAEILQPRFHLDDEDLALAAKRHQVGAAAVGERHFRQRRIAERDQQAGRAAGDGGGGFRP